MSESIIVARSLPEAHELSNDTISGVIPGFVVDIDLLRKPQSDVRALLEHIQPENHPFEAIHKTNKEQHFRYPPHVDVGSEGISVNFYRRGGPVRVELATLLTEIKDPNRPFFVCEPFSEEFRTPEMSPSLEELCAREDVHIGQVFSGDITEGSMTVFFAGTDDNRPAIHYFNRLQTGYSHAPQWSRLNSLKNNPHADIRVSKDYRKEKAEDNIEIMSGLIVETLATL